MSAGGKSSSKRGRPAAAASAEILELPKSPELVVIANAETVLIPDDAAASSSTPFRQDAFDQEPLMEVLPMSASSIKKSRPAADGSAELSIDFRKSPVHVAIANAASMQTKGVANTSSSSPPRLNASDQAMVAAVQPMSPASNRDRFHASCMPNTISCDLSTVSTQAGLKFSFAGIVLVVYPASNNPLRRHILLGDGRGTVGVTVWNTNVGLFSSKSVGQLAQFTKLAMTCHNNTRGLVLNKESTVTLSVAPQHFASIWWMSLRLAPAVQAIFFHDTADNTIVNVAGIIGSVTKEDKTVKNAPMSLLTVRLVDRTGVIMVRSWTHSAEFFQSYVDKPMLIRRVRVTAFANCKIGELLDGDGSEFLTAFDNSEDLSKFWSE
jgi:hypothetical protein